MSYLTKDFDYKNVLYNFEQLTKIPHGSGNTKAISDYVRDFAKEKGLDVYQDDSNNLIIRVPASKGFEDRKTVMIQGHLDMVCEKEASSKHDFEKDPLDIYIENGALHAKGTTLGGDDGIAIAYMMSLMTFDEPHPELELLMTTDEETGMYGAKDLDKSLLKASYLINCDSEEEGWCFAGCAGGLRQDISFNLERAETTGTPYILKVSGLTGGHSGVEINKNRINANKLMARVLFMLRDEVEYFLLDIRGGKLDNAITRDCESKFVSDCDELTVKKAVEKINDTLRNESSSREPGLNVSVEVFKTEEKEFFCLTPLCFEKLLYFLVQCPYGIQRMSADVPGLVESSLNLGVLNTTEENANIRFSIRSSVSSMKHYISDKLAYLAELLGASSETEGEYPAWEYRKNSYLRDCYVKLFKEEYGNEPRVEVMHAGLECGLLFEAKPELDIISIGPDMKDVHSPNEQLSLESAVRVYKFLEKLLIML